MAASTPRLFPEDVREALDRGDKIEAIKRLRNATGLGLKEAKEMIEQPGAQEHSLAVNKSVEEALRAGKRINAIKLLREQKGWGLKEAKEAIDDMIRSGAFPEVNDATSEPRRSNLLIWIVIAVVGIAAYYLFFRT